MIEAIIKAWYRVVTTEYLKKLAHSMLKQCQAVLQSTNWLTKC